MQSVSSRIWTRVAVSITYDDNHYTTGTSETNEYLLVLNLQSMEGVEDPHILTVLAFLKFVGLQWLKIEGD